MTIHFGDKKHVWKCSVITGIMIFCILCSVSLFVFSYRFVNAEITPKWLGLTICVGIAGLTGSIPGRTITLHTKTLIAFMCCFLFIFVRKWITSGFDAALLIYLNGLLLLFFTIRRTVSFCQPQYLSGTVIVCALTLSIQGMLQFIEVLPSGNNFLVTGNFDNPAGFSAALACALPLCFLFLKHKKRYLRYSAMVTAALIAITVFLSGSRAGITAIAVSMTVWLIARLKFTRTGQEQSNHKRSKILLAIVLLLALPIVLYFFKKDSADGRLLIWQCSTAMIAEKPVFGHGQGAFQAKYMLYQAAYMNAHPDSRFAPLADNVLHPFNEYLLVLTEHGFAGLGLVVLFGLLLFRAYRREPNDEKLSAMMSLLALSVFSFFSYPFKYPFAWVLLFLNTAIIFNSSGSSGINTYSLFAFTEKRFMFPKLYPRIITVLLSAGLLTYSVMLARAEIKWKRIARFSMVKELPEYDKLYRWLGSDGLFLYNHAAELYEAKEFENSLAVFERCTRFHNDMDVQMFLAADYKALGKLIEAERHYKIAAAMCPVRFMPLYELVKLYDDANRRDEAFALAGIIIDKDVKVPSPTITAIKQEMRLLIEVQETGDEPAPSVHTLKPSGNEETRQGETPKAQPNGAALPQ